MKTIVVIGGGSGGISTANHLSYKLRDKIKANEIRVMLMDPSKYHYYQPGFLEIPFGLMKKEETYKEIDKVLAQGVTLLQEKALKIDLANRSVQTDKGKYTYDYLVIATGARYDYSAIPGFVEGVDHFYTLEGSNTLRKKLNDFKGGTVVVGISSMPYKCTPAPLEAAFLLHDMFKSRNMQDKVKIIYTYPMPMVFPDKRISDFALGLFKEKGIESVLDFKLKEVDSKSRDLISISGEKIHYDLALIAPPHRGSELIAASGFGDQSDWVPVDKFTLNITGYKNAFAIGDATNLQVSKAGSVADAEAVVVSNRIAEEIDGYNPETLYDGSGGALMITGIGKASMISSNYNLSPVFMPESYSFYWLKLIYNKVYWNMTAKAVLSEVA
ncbi:dihydrolipoamide dehydrogenase [Thermoplasmatales archaeon]|nr:dihydrolipoamide dehydrogenase [Thermoplasmatales archaeon]